MIVEIIRLEDNRSHGTFGKLRINKSVFCDTLEPTDRENKKNISSIPVGQYICSRVLSNKYNETFEVCDVEDRSNILFHWGNFDDNTQGCILVGNGISNIDGRKAVLQSKDTFKRFMRSMDHVDTFHLTISEHY